MLLGKGELGGDEVGSRKDFEKSWEGKKVETIKLSHFFCAASGFQHWTLHHLTLFEKDLAGSICATDLHSDSLFLGFEEHNDGQAFCQRRERQY